MYHLLSKKSKNDCPLSIILLPGRGQSSMDILSKYENYFDSFHFFAIEPVNEWYPAPHGIRNQNKAVEGVKSSAIKLNDFILQIENKYNIQKSKIVLSGFSAGGVMSIQTALCSDLPYAAVICHNGAILEPENLNLSKNDMPFLLFHNSDDNCFTWEERYLPTKKSLIEKKYNVTFKENNSSGHNIDSRDVRQAIEFIRLLI